VAAEIRCRIFTAAGNTCEVTATMEGVRRAATDTGVAARSVFESAQAMADQSDILDGEVGRLLAGLRAA
jgi:methyl-accepting chemotaxis protein